MAIFLPGAVAAAGCIGWFCRDVFFPLRNRRVQR
jgi:hypothetical protein